MTRVRVGIVSWNTADLLDRCLAALPAALGDVDAEVVVVDNDSDDDSVSVAASHPWVRLQRNPANFGYAVAMNQALAGDDADVLIALNPDTLPPPGSLRRLVEVLEEHPPTGLVVPRLAHPNGRLQHSAYRFPSVPVALAVCFLPARLRRGRIGRWLWLEGAATHDRETSVDWAIGAVHVIRGAAVAPGPPYSERWFMYVEDVELCWRLRQSGWEVRLVPEVTVPHVGNAAGAQAFGDSRGARYWSATYEFATTTRGRLRTRLLAAANAVGASWVLLRRRVATALGRDDLSAGSRSALRAEIRVHARVAGGR